MLKKIDSSYSLKQVTHHYRPSQSLHAQRLKNRKLDTSNNVHIRSIQCLTMCIIYKKKKMQFGVKNNTSFQQLNKQLYQEFYKHLLAENQNNQEKAQKIIKTVVGFESVDGDTNFDYRLSLNKGFVQKTKFFYPLISKPSVSNNFRYKIYNCLAIGGFSKVYLARSLQNGQFYAIKFMRKFNPNSEQSFFDKDKFDAMKNEVSVCDELNHPFLVRMVHAFQTEHFYCLVFDYCPGGQLFFLLKRVRIMSEAMARFYFLQILFGMQYIHSKHIIYRDLKPENILIDADGNCKLVDFGLSKRVDSRSKTFSYCGSAEYMAPQMILRTGHSYGVDHYSLGAFLYELVTGLPPFYTKNHEQLQESIICKDLTFPAHIELSNQIKDLLDKLLKKEQKIRLGSYIGIKQIIFHPWIGKINSAQILSKNIDCPFTPNLEEYNFDNTELGEDEEEFTALVRFDTNKKGCILKEYIKNKISSEHIGAYIQEIIDSCKQYQKENSHSFKPNGLTEILRQRSKERLQNIFKSQRLNMLEKSEERKVKELNKLSPYFSCKQVSPKKKKEIMDFIEHKIIKLDKVPSKVLKRIKISKNKMINQTS